VRSPGIDVKNNCRRNSSPPFNPKIWNVTKKISSLVFLKRNKEINEVKINTRVGQYKLKILVGIIFKPCIIAPAPPLELLPPSPGYAKFECQMKFSYTWSLCFSIRFDFWPCDNQIVNVSFDKNWNRVSEVKDLNFFRNRHTDFIIETRSQMLF